MQFDRFTIALLILRPDAPQLDEDAENALQDAHLAELHETGHLLAAGPLLGAPDREVRGLSILRVDPERAHGLLDEDPAVRAGRYSVKILPWVVPGGAAAFSPTRFPRSTAEAGS